MGASYSVGLPCEAVLFVVSSATAIEDRIGPTSDLLIVTERHCLLFARADFSDGYESAFGYRSGLPGTLIMGMWARPAVLCADLDLKVVWLWKHVAVEGALASATAIGRKTMLWLGYARCDVLSIELPQVKWQSSLRFKQRASAVLQSRQMQHCQQCS